MKRTFTILLVLLVCLSFVVCSGSREAFGATPIIIGTTQPLTGTQANPGNDALRAVQLAVKQKNAKGGLNGSPIQLVAYDSQGIPEEAVKVVTRLIEVDKINFMIGDTISSCLLAAGNIINGAKMLTIGTGLSSTWMEQGWEYIWRACVNNGRTMPVAAQTAYDMGIRTMGVMHGQDDANMSAWKAFREAGERIGLTFTTAETYIEGDTDFSGQIAKIIQTNPDAILMSSHGPTMGAFLRQLRGQGFSGIVFVKETFTSDSVQQAGPACDGVVFIYPYVTYLSPDECDDPMLRTFLEEFLKEFGQMPIQEHSYRAYDSMNVLFAAAEKAGSNDTQAIMKALGTISGFKGLVGTLDFTKGDREGVSGKIGGFVVLGGKYVPLEGWVAKGGHLEYLKK
ncbi:ethanolamine utilization protein EutJ [Synergistales bacterium]|nr:ethanolamine utilization protein EutJ [Synergistales bacterium]